LRRQGSHRPDVVLALLLLTFAFRTILVPIKSIIGFPLSISASFGALVAFFQWGWGQKPLGITPGPKTGDARGAVTRGTARSARVVTAAALVMVAIVVAFMAADDPTIRSIGFSFAIGVFIDAFVIRLTLVPAVMAIVGDRLWCHPRWFARHVPDPDIEGERLAHELAQPAPPEPPPVG
jgi:RND superfamily putative drug exporter